MIQVIEYSPRTASICRTKFGENSSATTSQNKEAEAVSSKKGNLLMTTLMLTGAAAVGVLGHKMYVSKAEKGASKVAEASSSATEILHKVAVKDFEKTALHAKFVESKKSILTFIQETEAKPEEMKEFLLGVTAHAEKSEEFVKEVIADPRKSRAITRTLVEKVGGQKNFVDWYFAPQGYQRAYKRFMKKAFESAKTPEELLKMSPNWHYHRLMSKFGKDFTVGELPKGFGTIEAYRDMAGKILRGKGEELPNGIKRIQEFESGFSDKAVFLIEADGKKYIFKMHKDYEEYYPTLKTANDGLRNGESTQKLKEEYFAKIEENHQMKSDSVFINAQLDFYLKSHNCTNVANIHFFDAKTKSSLYEVVEGEPIKIEEAQILDVNRNMSDLNSLGIIYNDINNNNFRVKNGKMGTIDSGESSYIDVLRPGCADYHFKLPNWSGMDLPSCLAGINLDKI